MFKSIIRRWREWRLRRVKHAARSRRREIALIRQSRKYFDDDFFAMPTMPSYHYKSTKWTFTDGSGTVHSSYDNIGEQPDGEWPEVIGE